MKTKRTLLAAALLFAGGLANAALTPEELKQLGTTLTPWGAIKAGNKEGTIPAYEGGLPTSFNPPGFKPNSGHWVDPFADEKPLYSITAANVDKYADVLNDAQKEMFKRFPKTWRMDVYPTHRIVNYPKYYIDSSLKNAANPECKTIENGMSLAGCKGGMPFPIPKTANEAIFNITAFGEGSGSQIQSYRTFYANADGKGITPSHQITYSWKPYHDPRVSAEKWYENGATYSTVCTRVTYPARSAGTENCTNFVADHLDHPNVGYSYSQGVRRVRITPEAGYDYPVLSSGGSQFYDESVLFLGKQDKFDWKLLGKKEMIIPYNSYRINEAGPDKQIAAGGGHHPNPDLLRWELHRVWVVEGVLKAGERHAFSKRRIYSDEDFSAFGMNEAWDQAGNIYKGLYMTGIWLWDKQAAWVYPNIAYSIPTGIWYYSALIAESPGITVNDTGLDWSFFKPEAIMRRNQR